MTTSSSASAASNASNGTPIENRLAALEKKVKNLTWTSTLRSIAPLVFVVLLWVGGMTTLYLTKDEWAWDTTGTAWGAVVLNSLVVISAFTSLAVVSIAALRRDW